MQATTAQSSIESSRHKAIVVTALTEFQKAQCMFWVAIDAATAAVFLAGSAEILGAKTRASFMLNFGVIKTICTCAVLFVTFGLYCLHLADKRSWYVFLLSLFTFGFSATAWGLIDKAPPEKLAPVVNSTEFEGCGAISPTNYCGVSFYNLGDSIQLGMVLFTSIIFFALLMDMITLNTTLGGLKAFRWWASESLPIGARWIPILRSSFRFASEITFLVFVGYLFRLLIALTYESRGETGKHSWGFGQVIALTIWVPTLIEWVYAIFRESKLERHVNHVR